MAKKTKEKKVKRTLKQRREEYSRSWHGAYVIGRKYAEEGHGKGVVNGIAAKRGFGAAISDYKSQKRLDEKVKKRLNRYK